MFKKIFAIFATILLSVNIIQANANTHSSVFSHPSSIKEASQKMPALNSACAKFRQEKLLPDNKTVLQSSGDFEYVKDKGMVFKTTHPLQSTSYYSPDDFLFAVSNKGNFNIEKNFDIFFIENESKNSWTLGLVPKKNSKMEKQLNSVVIEGKDNAAFALNKIVISTKNSGKTTIWFEKN
ncbi:signal peptide protein [Candidatus Gastranaerophilus sp. (ex Termes propinquus)]|nr:signal peptide protein [Candidatus Gastranaerophilus sp. (ex Termes propinquus)]